MAWQILLLFGSPESRARCHQPESLFSFPWERAAAEAAESARADELRRLMEDTRRLNEKE